MIKYLNNSAHVSWRLFWGKVLEVYLIVGS